MFQTRVWSCIRGLLLSLTLLFLTGCSEEENPAGESTPTDPAAGLIAYGEVAGDGFTAKLFAADSLKVGMNHVMVQLVDTSGEPLLPDSIAYLPMMHMMEMDHSCPHGSFVPMESRYSFYAAETMFIMPSGMMGTWDLELTVTAAPGGEADTVVFEDVLVLDSPWMQRFTYEPGEGDPVYYFTALEGLEDPIVGLNPVRLSIARRETLTDFPFVEDLTVTVETYMPSMGHGSTGNVDPSGSGGGHYEGVVAFNMTGDWEVTFAVTDTSGTELGQVVYALVF